MPKKQSALSKLLAAVALAGGEYDKASGKQTRPCRQTGEWGFSLMVDAPPKKIWRASGSHSLVEEQDDIATREEMNQNFDRACESMTADILEGAEDCPDPDCED